MLKFVASILCFEMVLGIPRKIHFDNINKKPRNLAAHAQLENELEEGISLTGKELQDLLESDETVVPVNFERYVPSEGDWKERAKNVILNAVSNPTVRIATPLASTNVFINMDGTIGEILCVLFFEGGHPWRFGMCFTIRGDLVDMEELEMRDIKWRVFHKNLEGSLINLRAGNDEFNAIYGNKIHRLQVVEGELGGGNAILYDVFDENANNLLVNGGDGGDILQMDSRLSFSNFNLISNAFFYDA